MKTKRIFFAATVVWIIFLPNCTSLPEAKSKYIKNGKQYGVVKGLFRARWLNFYERGASFSEGEFWQEALTDFKEIGRAHV